MRRLKSIVGVLTSRTIDICRSCKQFWLCKGTRTRGMSCYDACFVGRICGQRCTFDRSKGYAADIAHGNLLQGDLLSLCTMFIRDSRHMDITGNGTYSNFLHGSLFTPFIMQMTEINFWQSFRSIYKYIRNVFYL